MDENEEVQMTTKSTGSSKAGSGKAQAKPAANAPAKPNTTRAHVVKDAEAGDWKVKVEGNPKPVAKAPTQAKAEGKGKAHVKDAGGGQVIIHDPRGRIRDADTVKPGSESPKKDTKH